MPVCQGCNGSFDGSFAFCPYCGRAKPETPKIKLEVDLTRKKSLEDCPKCDNDINTQKVSSIVASGTKRGIGSSSTSGDINIRGRDGKRIAKGQTFSQTNSYTLDQSDLAQFLKAPVEPQRKKTDFSSAWVFFFSLIMLTIVLATDGPPICIVIFIIMIVVSFFGLARIKPTNEENEKTYQEKLLSYKKTKYVWDHLYYCHKHDIVFMEGRGNHFPVESTLEACTTLANELNFIIKADVK